MNRGRLPIVERRNIDGHKNMSEYLFPKQHRSKMPITITRPSRPMPPQGPLTLPRPKKLIYLLKIENNKIGGGIIKNLTNFSD